MEEAETEFGANSDIEEDLEEWSSKSLSSNETTEQETQTLPSEEMSGISIPSTILEVPEEELEEAEYAEEHHADQTHDILGIEETSTAIEYEELSETEPVIKEISSLEHDIPDTQEPPEEKLDISVSEPGAIETEEEHQVSSEATSVSSPPSTQDDWSLKGATFQQMFEETRVRSRKAGTGQGEKVNVLINCSNGQKFRVNYFHYTNIAELKEDMGKYTHFSPDQILLTLPDGKPLGDWLPLAALVTPENPSLEIHLTFCLSLAGDEEELEGTEPPCPRILKERTIQIADAFCRTYEVNIITEHINFTKEWLGGFKDKLTGKIYHHASTMTKFSKFGETTRRQSSRQAQTTSTVDQEVQLDRQHSVQTYTTDIFQDSAPDKIILPKPYIEFDPSTNPVLIKEHEAAKLIQRKYRSYMSRKRARGMFNTLIDLIKYQRGAERKKRINEMYEELELKRTLGTLFPRSRKDFFYLYVYIGNWWKEQMKIIKEMEDPYERMADCMLLLKREIDWLFLLESKRIKSRNAALFRRRIKVLEDGSRPIMHKTLNHTTAIESLAIQRAKEIKEVYTALRRRDISNRERIEGLLKLIGSALKYENGQGMHLCELMHREVDLLNIDVPPHYLEGLRKRIEEEILRLSDSKDFNPQGQHYRPLGYPTIKSALFKCLACGMLKHAKQFPLHTRMKSLGNCLSCSWRKEMNHEKTNLAPYEFILMCLRRKEAQRCPSTIYPFLVQPFGAYGIVNLMWNRHSAISENSDLEQLRMTRWNQKEDWKPWNNIVLTEEECDYHDSLQNNSDAYSEEFIQAINIRNLQVKDSFLPLQDIVTFAEYSGLVDRNMYVGSSIPTKSLLTALQRPNPFLLDPPFKAFKKDNKQQKSKPCRNISNYITVKDLKI